MKNITLNSNKIITVIMLLNILKLSCGIYILNTCITNSQIE